jgi:uncharacterized protein (TIGR00251 family)
VDFDVLIIPRAGKSEIGGLRDDAVVVRVSAPPVEGAANEALTEVLAEALGVARRAVRIVSGEKSRRKRVAIAGVTAERVRAILSR